MLRLDKQALVTFLCAGLLMTAFAGCQPKGELEEASTTASTKESTEVEVSEEVLPATDKKKQDEILNPPGYNEVEPMNPNLIVGEEEI